MKRALLTFSLLFASETSVAESIYKPVAMVDTKIITEHDLEQKRAILKMTGVDSLNPLDEVINETIILMKEQLPDEVINNAIIQLASENNMSVDQLLAGIKSSNIDLKAFKRHIASQMSFAYLLSKDVNKITSRQKTFDLYKNSWAAQNQIKTADAIFMAEVSHYQFNSNSKVKIAEIIVSHANQDHFKQVIEMIQAGDDFAGIKKHFPDTVQIAGVDGEVGWLNFNEMSTEYQQVISNTPIGQIASGLSSGDHSIFIKVLDTENIVIRKSLVNPGYSKLSHDDKALRILTSTQNDIQKDGLVAKLRKQHYIKLL